MTDDGMREYEAGPGPRRRMGWVAEMMGWAISEMKSQPPDASCECDICVFSRCLRLLLAVAEEGGMPTSRADALHTEAMAAVAALGRMPGRDKDAECAAALDALWDELDDDESDEDDDEGDDEEPEPVAPEPAGVTA